MVVVQMGLGAVERAAREIANVARQNFNAAGPVEGLEPQLERIVRRLLETENAAAEAIANGRGDGLHKQGREAEADVSYGIAAKIRMRRREHLAAAGDEAVALDHRLAAAR